jgi:hypothetical protein
VGNKKKSQAEEIRAAKVKAKEDKEVAKVLEQSRLEAGIAAKELKSLPSTPAVPTPLNFLGSRGLVICDAYGNLNISSSSSISLATPISQAISLGKGVNERSKNKSHHHFLPRSLDRSSESKDSRAPDALEKKSSVCALTRESKNSFVNSGSLASESLLPTSEAKSDTESELNLFTFPEVGGMTVSATSSHSPLLPCTNEFLVF